VDESEYRCCHWFEKNLEGEMRASVRSLFAAEEARLVKKKKRKRSPPRRLRLAADGGDMRTAPVIHTRGHFMESVMSWASPITISLSPPHPMAG
jgi:hypothetical protein